MFADEIRRAIEAASRITLPQVTALLWRAYGEGKVSEAEAEALSGLIEARTDTPASRRLPPIEPTRREPFPAASPPNPVAPARRSTGARPRTDASLERRRRWAASGRLPPGLATRFTPAEQAVLALVAAEVARRKDCRLSIEHMAAVAGVCRSSVKNAVREARRLGLLTVEERQITGFRNDTNVIRVVAAEWLAWIRLARRRDPVASRRGPTAAAPPQGSGVKEIAGTSTQVLNLSESGTTEPSEGCRKAAGDLDRSDHLRIRASGGTDRAMR